MPETAHRTTRAAVLGAVLGLLSFNQLLAAPSREEYELQERCGRRAAELFKRDWGKEGLQSGQGKEAVTARYRSYYHPQLNRCFVLYTVRTVGLGRTASRSSTLLHLYEANTNKDFGFFFSFDDEPRLMDCSVAERKCQSRQEWDALAARFLGD